MDKAVEHQMSALLALAHDRTEQGRMLLAEKLANIFFSESLILTWREEQLVNGLIDDLLKNENPTVRQALINRFSQTIDIPHNVAARVARGPIDIARQVLIENENLEDDDLITVVETKSTHHAEAVASRRKISEAVADALVETGDLRVMQLVAENLGAKLSLGSLEVLVESARLSALLQKPILLRPELTRESAAYLYWWTSHDLRRATLDRFGFGPGKLDEELNKAIEEMLSSHLLQKDDTQVMEHLADWLAERGAIEINNLLQILRAGHYKLFNIALSRMTKLELPVVETITSEKGGRKMCALCRAINIDKGKFISIFLMARGGRTDEHIVHPRELSDVLAVFDRLVPDVAQSVLQTWRVNPSSVLEPETVESEKESAQN